MKIPISWLKEYIKIDKTPQEIADSFTALGLMQEKPVENEGHGPILELEHRMDRSDWLSIVGCARDLAAMEGLKLTEPEGETPKSNGNGKVEIIIEASDLVKRFNTRVFRNIKVKESPKWLKDHLESYGMPSINNIVDITNFVMVEYGQPMHAQDLDKLKKQQIIFRKAKKGEVAETLLGEKIELDEENLVMTDGKQILGIGGIVGSPTSAVDKNTTDIILDAGNYNQASMRNTSRKLNIRNETVLRTEKFLHPHLTQVAVERATKLILELAGGDYYENEDYYPEKAGETTMKLRYERIEKVGGIKIDKRKVQRIVEDLGYKIKDKGEDSLKLAVPYFRTDVMVEDDIVSDVLRINDYKNIPLEMISTSPPKEVTPEIYKFEEQCRDELVKLGLHEHITNPLVKAGENNRTQVLLENALNSEQNAMRTTIYETLKPVVEVYKKHKMNYISVFEVGKTYHKTGEEYSNYQEIPTIEVVVALGYDAKQANNSLKRILAAFLQNLGVDNVRYEPDGNDKKTAIIYQGDLELGNVKIDSFTLFTENLLKAKKTELRTVGEFMNLSTKDVTLELEKGTALGPIIENLKNEHPDALKIEYLDTFDKNGKDSVTFRLYVER